MMSCTHCRSALLADPRADAPDLHAHLEACDECARFRDQLLRFEDRLGRALRVNPRARVLPFPGGDSGERPQHLRRGRLAAAASLLLGAVIAGGLWVAAPGASLAAAVVAHMAEEPTAWARTEVAVPASQLNRVLDESHIRLKTDAGLITYANSCQFRGHRVPHLVVQTEAGPVTVMVLTHEPARQPVRFDEHGYRGVIVPVPEHGSIAVLERGSQIDMATIEGVESQVLRAIDWTA
jgi:hypothetical protein